jgi:subtilisin family serine protease
MHPFARSLALTALTIGATLVAVAPAGADDSVRRLDALLARDPSLHHDPGSILVSFAPGTPEGTAQNVLALVGGKITQSYTLVPGLHEVEVADADQALIIIAGAPFVDFAQPNHIVRATAVPNDPRFNEQWGLHNTGQLINGSSGKVDADIDAPEGWDIYTGDPARAIGIIDNGVLYTHPDLIANIWVNPGETANGLDDDGNGYIDDIRGWDWVDDDNAPLGSDGHGTRNAGLAGAVGNNAKGIAGVAWNCKLVCLRFLGPAGGLESDAIAALQYCVNKNIKISNNSWSSAANYSQALYNAINAARTAGHLFVCASANLAKDLDNTGPDYPSSYNLDNIISVAATTDKDLLWPQSNYGAISVDLGAPGHKVLSTTVNNGYNFGSGTSFASPHVAGVAALVWGKNPAWTYAQVRTRILTTVRPIPALSGKTATGGVVNAAAALVAQGPPVAPSNLTAVNLGGGKAKLNWQDNSNNETRFTVQRQVHTGTWGGTIIVVNTAPNIITYTDSPGPGLFRYRVRAANTFGFSVWTPWKLVTVN